MIMLESTFTETTLPHNYFKLIFTNTNGTCCYHSILKLLRKHGLVKKNMNTKIIQAKAVNWIIHNKNLYLDTFNLTLQDYVLYNHSLDSFSDYITNYKQYSADNGSISWGGIPELIALSHIYNININIYTGKAYDKKNHRLIKGTIVNNKTRKDFRFQLLVTTTRQYNITVNLLYIKINPYLSHFIALDDNINY